MRIVYFGNNVRGARCLQAVLDSGWTVVGVVAHPESTALFGETVADIATARGLPLHRPARVNSQEFVDILQTMNPDLCVLSGYSQIIRRAILDVPKMGTINLHGGLIPQYRGSSITRWAIINGERTAGVSILEVDEGIDTGPVVAQEKFALPADCRIRYLFDKQLEVFPGLLLSTLEQYAAGNPEKHPQIQSEGCYWHALTPKDSRIDWREMSAARVLSWVRAFGEPYAGASCCYQGREVRLIEAVALVEHFGGLPGRICGVRDSGVVVMAADGGVLVQKIQIDDVVMDARGNLRVGETLT